MKNKTLLILCTLVLSLACSCERAAEDIYSDVTLNAVCGEMRLVSVRVDNSVTGNFFRNLNTGEEYDYPLFVNGQCMLRVLKGVYIFAFDGTATLPDGTTRRVRCYEHRSPNNSVNILDDEVELTFELLAL